MAATEPYERLLELCRRERELVAPDRIDELLAVQLERSLLLSALTEDPPPEVRASLEEAQIAVLGSIVELAFARDNLRADLEHLGRGRTAVASYFHVDADANVEAVG